MKFRGQIPPLEQTISGLRTGLLLAILVIFLLLAANFPVDPVVAGHHSDDPRGALRRSADAPADGHDAEHSIVHGRDHGDRNRGGELDSAGHVRRTFPARRQAAARSRREGATSRLRAILMTAARDDLRHGADGDRARRRRIASRRRWAAR